MVDSALGGDAGSREDRAVLDWDRYEAAYLAAMSPQARRYFFSWAISNDAFGQYLKDAEAGTGPSPEPPRTGTPGALPGGASHYEADRQGQRYQGPDPRAYFAGIQDWLVQNGYKVDRDGVSMPDPYSIELPTDLPSKTGTGGRTRANFANDTANDSAGGESLDQLNDVIAQVWNQTYPDRPITPADVKVLKARAALAHPPAAWTDPNHQMTRREAGWLLQTLKDAQLEQMPHGIPSWQLPQTLTGSAIADPLYRANHPASQGATTRPYTQGSPLWDMNNGQGGILWNGPGDPTALGPEQRTVFGDPMGYSEFQATGGWANPYTGQLMQGDHTDPARTSTMLPIPMAPYVPDPKLVAAAQAAPTGSGSAGGSTHPGGTTKAI
jgi:hypothetical protein